MGSSKTIWLAVMAALTGCSALPPDCTESQLLCASACVDAQSDEANCGACDVKCGAGEVCVSGSCTPHCPQDQTLCSDECVSLRTNRDSCGNCGSACESKEVCSQGLCTLSCQSGLTQCEDNCVNLQTDRAYCGDCNTYCGAGQVCSAGTCQVSCQNGLTNCSGSCVNLQSDRAYCGNCGTICPSGMVCNKGQCAASCATPLVDCSNSCVDTRYDPAHCGGCDAACPSYDHGSAVCASGICDLGPCQDGWNNCDGNAANGCETDLSTTTSSCGACGVSCSGGRSCSSGACTKRVFVSSQIYDGNMGGLDGADAKCQALADAAGIGGTYRAWLAIDDANSPATRFAKSPGAYALVDGTVIASSFADLTDGTLQSSIRLTELGGTPPASTDACGTSAVWTNTSANGEGISSGASFSCAGFTSTTGQSQFGRTDMTNATWSLSCTSAKSCNRMSPLFCFEQ